jgi:nucleoside-specific outer membrane channel protein Tsx
MKKTLIALTALGALSTFALADNAGNGEQQYDSQTYANDAVVVEPANADNPILPLKKVTPDDEQRRLDEKNGSRG